jgi:hypothetical protein
MYLLSFVKFPKWAIKVINSQMSHFFWDNIGDSHKYYLTSWDLVSQKNKFGGLGIQNIRDFNLCLLASWIIRYHMDNNKIWRMIVDYKYDLSPNLLSAKHVLCSPFWKGLFKSLSCNDDRSCSTLATIIKNTNKEIKRDTTTLHGH